MKSFNHPGSRFFRYRCSLIGSLCSLALSVASPSAAQFSFRGLGHLPGGTSSQAQALSGDGLVVVGTAGSSLGNQAFRWTSAGGIVGLGDLPGGAFESGASGVSTDGSVVTGTASSTLAPPPGYEAFRWTAADGMVGSGHPSGHTGLGASANGLVVVGARVTAAGSEAYRWVYNNPLIGLGDLPGGAFNSQATAASADGAVIVGLGTSAAGMEAFRWTSAGEMVGLGDLPGGPSLSLARGVSLDGTVVVGFSHSASGSEAFRWTSGGGMVGLGDLPGGAFSSVGWGVSADGKIVVGSGASASGIEAAVWDQANGMRSIRDLLIASGIDMTGWQLFEARGVSANGSTIVGIGRNPAGNNEGWIVTIALPPTLAQQTTLGLGTIVQAGPLVDLQFNVTGTPPVTVQWQRNGVDIPGALVTPDAGIAHLFMVGAHPSIQGPYTAYATDAGGTSTIAINNQAQFVVEESTWQWRNPLPTALGSLGVTVKGNGEGFMLYGARGYWASSTNGVNWTQLPSFATAIMRGYTFGNGLHVGWTSAMSGALSLDGSEWYSATMGGIPESGEIALGESTLTTQLISGSTDIVFGKGLFVAFQGSGSPGRIMTSSDAKSWTLRETGVPDVFGRAAFGAGTFLARTLGGQLVRSDDGITWSAPQAAPFSSITLVRFANDRFYLGNNAGLLASSPDGITWTFLNSGTTRQLNAIAFGSGRYVLVGGSGTIRVSDNGADWLIRNSTVTTGLSGVGYANDTWCVATNGIVLTSTNNGETWANQFVAPSTAQLNGIATDGATSLIAVGASGHVVRSTNGANWNRTTPAGDVELRAIAHHGGAYYAAGANGTIISSTDNGITFTPETSGTSATLFWIGPLNGAMHAAGAGGIRRRDTSGAGWTPVYSNPIEQLNGAAFGANAFVAVGANGRVLSSADGASWTSATIAPVTLNSVAFGNGAFVAVGGAGTILRSTTGAGWTSHSIPIPENFVHVAFTEGVFVVSGSPSGVFVSNDGISWRARITGTADATAIRATTTYQGHVYGVGLGGAILSAKRAPEVGLQPSIVTTVAGTKARLETIPVGSILPTAYLWFKDGAPVSNSSRISGATSPVLTIAPVQVSDAGNYTLRLANAQDGNVVSRVIKLAVGPANQAPQFTLHPVDQIVTVGGNAAFTVAASGTPAPGFQWFIDVGGGTWNPLANTGPYSGATTSTLVVANTTAAMSGHRFRCVASNGVVPDAISNAASLTHAALSIASISPATAIANGPGIVLTVTGSPFITGTVVQWNNQPRPTTFISNTEVRATIPASDLLTTQDLLLVLVTVSNGSGNVSVPKVFTVKHASMGELEANFIPAGATRLVSTAPDVAGQAGLTVLAQNVGGDPLLIAAGTYTGTPPSGLVFNSGGIYYDIKVSGADSADSVAVNFYYPSTVTGSNELRLRLTYYNGTAWVPVRSSGNDNPLKNTTDNLDSTISGGRFTVVLDNTSKPKITELNGTIFALVNTAPMVAITGSSVPIQVNTAATIGISYQAIGTPATQQLSVAWGDGLITPATSTASGNTTATHMYTLPGVYTVMVTVTDVFGDSDSDDFNYITVYDPSARFVTGAGWINSPPGAYRLNSTLIGKAHFGFVSRYQNGAKVPTGQTQFTFQIGNLSFHSTDYEWLVVAGARAQFKGSGKINGAGNYGFLLTATDGAGPGGGGVDGFRIKIWDKAILTRDNILYDNVYGSSEDINASGLQALGGGNIVIHRR